MSTSTWWRSVTRAVRWHRRRLAALAAAIAVGATILALRPAPTPTVPVLVAATDLPSGQRLSAEHLRTVDWAADVVPERAITDPAAVTGRVAAGPITRGSPLTEVSVVSPRLTEPGRVLMPVTPNDPNLLAVLQVGDRIDILTHGPEGPVALARNARVAALPHTEAAGGGVFGGESGGTPLLVDVSEAEAQQVAGVAGSPITLILR